jgi:hypothetical protein
VTGWSLFTYPYSREALNGHPALRGWPATAGKQQAQSMSKEKKKTRKDSPPIKVYCLPDERERIDSNAKAAGMSLSAFLLAVGQGYQVQGITDYERVRELARINGDLGRLGGLLKLWLTYDVRTAAFGADTILRLLARIEATQDEMAQVMKSIVRPRAD